VAVAITLNAMADGLMAGEGFGGTLGENPAQSKDRNLTPTTPVSKMSFRI
jgi:hypothetical protein